MTSTGQLSPMITDILVRIGPGPLHLHLADGPPCKSKDLDGPHGASAIIRVNAFSCGWIDTLQFPAEFSRVDFCKLCTKRLVRLGPFHETAEEGLDVEVGSSDQDRPAVSCLDVADAGPCMAKPVINGKGITWINKVEQVVGGSGLFPARGLCSSDVHAPVDLH